MYGAIFSVVIVGSLQLGSLGTILKMANDGNRINFFDFNFDPTVRHTFWSQLIGGTFTYCSIYAVNQAQVQRLLTIGDLKRSQLSLWIQWPFLMILSCSISFAGLTIFAYYRDCDPLASGIAFDAMKIN